MTVTTVVKGKPDNRYACTSIHVTMPLAVAAATTVTDIVTAIHKKLVLNSRSHFKMPIQVNS